MISRALLSNATPHWSTPNDLRADLEKEFGFTLDPCPLQGTEGLTRSWKGERVYCNPPYGPGILKWLKKSKEADLAVFLLPSRTDTVWWHGWAMQAEEIRFIKGRLKFGGAKNSAPFPSVLLIFRKVNT